MIKNRVKHHVQTQSSAGKTNYATNTDNFVWQWFTILRIQQDETMKSYLPDTVTVKMDGEFLCFGSKIISLCFKFLK